MQENTFSSNELSYKPFTDVLIENLRDSHDTEREENTLINSPSHATENWSSSTLRFGEAMNLLKQTSDNLNVPSQATEDLSSHSRIVDESIHLSNNKISIIHEIKKYAMIYKPFVFILTPCFGGVNYVNYTISLINTINAFNNVGIPLQISFCKNDSLISRARNNLIAKALTEERTTHCMFIDNDITWDPIDIFKLLIANKPLIGGIYPLKKYNWENLSKDQQVVSKWIANKRNSDFTNKIEDDLYIQNRMLSYNVNYLEPVLKIVENIAKVKHIATGFMLIQRNTILQMMHAFQYTKYKDDVGFLLEHENKYAYALFDCGVEEGHYFSEDWLFCHRWSKMGGDVFIDVTINLTHTGIEDYNGSYITSII